MARLSSHWVLILVAVAFALLAMLRPVDHDESQYVAATMLAWGGPPYRDFAYLQTPLQPLLLAPIAAAFGSFAWPGLRLVNAALSAAAVAFVFAAARRAGAGERTALAAALAMAACDILLFGAAMARNDALPTALLAAALWLAAGGTSRRSAFAIGLCLSAATAAKISFALPALAYGIWTLLDRRRLPLWVAIGAVPATLLVAFTYVAAPADFMFGVFDFPARAPAEYYAARPWKLSWPAKAIDTLKFLALGPALVALVIVVRDRGRTTTRWLDLLIVAGLVAALLPFPTWRQYLAPMLPPLFVRLALAWQHAPPARATRIAMAVFVGTGLAPSVEALAANRPAMLAAMREGAAIGAALNSAGVTGPVATLSPQFLPAARAVPDPRFAAGPFAWRTRALLAAPDQPARHIITPATLGSQFAAQPPQAILLGGEAAWSSGDVALDRPLEAWAIASGWQRLPIRSTRFRLYVRR
ncbi:hypothetical protein [Sphingomonas sp. 37zxx]|uniref:hypothetical protein n=1 Tax=Sphingomonas sp. 37zxx TaxID=1550073 RepID=UPI00068B206A|nr:hypothetical protein [Sphingomonas sp. 37zxx]